LVAVAKGFSANAIAAAQRHGQRAFGENYVQEAVEKIAALSGLGLDSRVETARHEKNRTSIDARGPSAGVASPEGPLLRPLEWHFIGPIQSNKTRAIAEHFAWVHSVDRLKIAQRLSAARPAGPAPLQICIQVNIGDESTKSGVAPGRALELAHAVAALPRLQLRGLMAIPAASADPLQQRRYFAQLRRLKDEIVAAGIVLDTLSMGMSADLEAAIAEGATLVRVGTAIFGEREKAQATEDTEVSEKPLE
jgi:uncharacterized pyridoxal phosphate-containing UPF0001 family protein